MHQNHVLFHKDFLPNIKYNTNENSNDNGFNLKGDIFPILEKIIVNENCLTYFNKIEESKEFTNIIHDLFKKLKFFKGFELISQDNQGTGASSKNDGSHINLIYNFMNIHNDLKYNSSETIFDIAKI